MGEKKEYFINGWKYGKAYFMSVGHFGENSIQRMEKDGKHIIKNGNEFWIKVKEE